jgi:hypothetical protein
LSGKKTNRHRSDWRNKLGCRTEGPSACWLILYCCPRISSCA